MIGANQAHLPIVEDDAFLTQVVADVGLVQLLCSTVHMSGGLDLIDGVQTKPGRFSGDGGGQIPDAQAAELRAGALAVIKAWRDAGCPEPYRPSDAELERMVAFLPGMDLGARYLPVIKDEMAYDGDTRRYVWPREVAPAEKEANPVLIIGGGMSGLLMAFRLKQAGIPSRVIEKNRGIGGTWHENRYPGCRVDVASQSYSFSFMQDYKWPTLYSAQPELEKYFNVFVDRFGLRELVSFETEVVRADYDERAHEWAVVLRGPDGAERTERARSLVSAVGCVRCSSTMPRRKCAQHATSVMRPVPNSFLYPAYASAWRWPENLASSRCGWMPLRSGVNRYQTSGGWEAPHPRSSSA